MATTVKESTEAKAMTGDAQRITVGPAAAKRAALAIYLIAVISGAVLMGVEIAGAKILAPGFGTSTFVWGSIIGMFMGAMAAGYFIGGWLADKVPSFSLLSIIVSLAGVWVLLIPRIGPLVADAIARSNPGLVIGPLSAAFAIFFVPSFLMGMVSPYAIKLRASSLTGLGTVAGNLYALSTAGSIVGTLLTTFWLIPTLFVSSVMQLLGITLVITALLTLALFKSAVGGISRDDRNSMSIMVLLALGFAEFWYVFPVQPHVPAEERLLHYEDSKYHEILVTERVVAYHQGGEASDTFFLLPTRMWHIPDTRHDYDTDIVRYLKFNANTESGIHPYRGEYKNGVEYTNLLHLPLMWVNNPKPKKLLVVGGGGAICPTQYHDWYGTQVDIAELDEEVQNVAQKYFQMSKDGITFHIGDGRQTIKQIPDHEYDVIILDAYSSGGQIPFHLMTWEFLREVKNKLTPRGVLATNIISALKNMSPNPIPPASLYLAEYRTLTATADDLKSRGIDGKQLFTPDQVYVFPKVYDPPLAGNDFEKYRNVIVICTQEEERRDIEQLQKDIKKLSEGSEAIIKIPKMLEYVNQLQDHPTDKELQDNKVPVLSDDYAPVDLMYRPVRFEEDSR
jgi:predicted membrane-bound spermidine synthase